VAVAFVSALTPHGFNRTGAPTTSPTFTPTNNGDYLLVMTVGSSGSVFSVTGTVGTFSQISGSYVADGQGDQLAFAENTAASAVSQHYTVQLGGFGFSSALEYSGVSASSNAAFLETNPAPATPGSIVGTPVTVPTGALLVCLVFDNTGVGGTITPVGGTTRDTGTNFSPWILADFAGTGATITPSFTPSNGGGGFGVLQVVLSPGGSTVTGTAAVTIGNYIAAGVGVAGTQVTGAAAVTIAPFVASGHGTTTTMVGIEVALAIERILAQGLVPVVLYAPDPTTPAGSIIPGSQIPPAGTVVLPGSQQALVSFVVSQGPPQPLGTVAVPNLIGMSAYAAQSALAAVPLALGNALWAVSNAPEGTVVAQSIPAGTMVTAAATIVRLTYSSGPTPPPPTVPVPTVS
jgi:hypothetical protein